MMLVMQPRPHEVIKVGKDIFIYCYKDKRGRLKLSLECDKKYSIKRIPNKNFKRGGNDADAGV